MNKNIFIDYFSFQNYRKFSDEIKLTLTTENNKFNFKETIHNTKIENRTESYNTAVGIIAKNAAGKSTIFNSLKLYFVFNNEGMYFRIRDITPFGIRESNNKLINFFDFNKLEKPIILKMSINSLKNKFLHEIEFYKNNSFKESIYIIKKMKEKKIWTKDSNNNPNVFNFLNLFNFLNSQEKLNSTNWSNLSEELKDFGNSLNRLCTSILFFESETNKQNLLSETLNEIFWDSKIWKNESQISNKINLIVRTIDDNVEKINFDIKKEENKLISMNLKNVELKNKNIIPISSLSEGTLKFLSKILPIIRDWAQGKNTYVFMDELDNSWHPKLAIFFIKLFQMKIFNNATLIFTAHNPYIYEFLRKDAIYLINNKNQFIRYNEIKTDLGISIRSDYKFAKNYLNENIGSSPNDKKFNEFCNEILKSLK